MPLTITEGYAPGCIGRITQLHARYYAVSSGFGLPFEAKVASELAAFCKAYVAGRDGLWLAQDGGIEGSIAIDGSRADADGAHLRWFILSEALRGRGIGRQMLAKALDFADARGYRHTTLWTFAGLDAARHLYEAAGFRLIHESPGEQWGKRVREQRFVRDARRLPTRP